MNTLSDDQLVAIYMAGDFPSQMARRFGVVDKDAHEALEASCVRLHNAGALDLLKLVEIGTVQALEGSRFFMAVHFLKNLLLGLDATPARMMACVEALVARGGDDGAASLPNDALREWCQRAPARARTILASARAGDDLARRHLTCAIEALVDIGSAREFALGDDQECRHAGIVALGRMPDNDPESLKDTIACFHRINESNVDDGLRASLLVATVRVLSLNGVLPSAEHVDLVRRIVAGAGELVLHRAAGVLVIVPAAVHVDIVTVLLEALRNVNASNKGTIHQLDVGLNSLLRSECAEVAVDFITDLLSGSEEAPTLGDFPCFIHAIMASPPEVLAAVAVRWLCLGSRRLCGGLAFALAGSGEADVVLQVRPEHLAISPPAQVFCCRKAIGYFFSRPVTAASVLVAVLRVCDVQTAATVQKLLVEPLLLNYGGLRSYLEGISPVDPAKPYVVVALAQNEAYLAGLRGIPRIREMEVSEHQRNIEHLRVAERAQEVRKQVEQRSVFANMVHRSVILYGRSSLMYVRDSDDSLRPMAVNLQSFGVAFELPRMEIADQFGLNYCLRIFRNERMPT